jgi:hypothetical protein
VRSEGTEEGVFEDLLGHELRLVIRAQRGPRSRAFQACYQKGGGGVAWSVRLAAVGLTAVALTAGAAAYAAAAGTGRAERLHWSQDLRQTVSSFGQQHGGGQGAAGTQKSSSHGASHPAPSLRPPSSPEPSLRLDRPPPATNAPQSQTGSYERTPAPRPGGSRSSPAPGSHGRLDRSRSTHTGRADRHGITGG